MLGDGWLLKTIPIRLTTLPSLLFLEAWSFVLNCLCCSVIDTLFAMKDTIYTHVISLTLTVFLCSFFFSLMPKSVFSTLACITLQDQEGLINKTIV